MLGNLDTRLGNVEHLPANHITGHHVATQRQRTTPTAGREVRDLPIRDRHLRQPGTGGAGLLTSLTAAPAPHRTRRRLVQPLLRRRHRRVPRVAPQPALQLSDPRRLLRKRSRLLLNQPGPSGDHREQLLARRLLQPGHPTIVHTRQTKSRPTRRPINPNLNCHDQGPPPAAHLRGTVRPSTARAGSPWRRRHPRTPSQSLPQGPAVVRRLWPPIRGHARQRQRWHLLLLLLQRPAGPRLRPEIHTRRHPGSRSRPPLRHGPPQRRVLHPCSGRHGRHPAHRTGQPRCPAQTPERPSGGAGRARDHSRPSGRQARLA